MSEKKQRGLFDALEQSSPPIGMFAKESANDDPFSKPAPSADNIASVTRGKGGPTVIPVIDYRNMVKQKSPAKAPRTPKEKVSDYDKWSKLPTQTRWNGDKLIIYGNIPSKSNSYKIITLPGKKQDCPECNGAGRYTLSDDPVLSRSEQCAKCDGSGKIPGHPHSSLGKTQDLKTYEKMFFIQSAALRDKNIEKEFAIFVDVFYPTRRSDLDNGLKILLDCLQTCRAIRNDNLCVHIDIKKHIDKENPRIEFKLNQCE